MPLLLYLHAVTISDRGGGCPINTRLGDTVEKTKDMKLINYCFSRGGAVESLKNSRSFEKHPGDTHSFIKNENF